MVRIMGIVFFVVFLLCSPALGANFPEKDVIKTLGGELEIFFLGHGTLMMNYNNMVIHVDPYSRVADYSTLPKADLILITHHHRDHLDPSALRQVRTEKTKIVLTELCASALNDGIILKNGDDRIIDNIRIEAVPAYNIVHRRDNGQVFHPKGEGNGYVLAFGDTKLYVAGDSENIPEMKALGNIGYAFLPMNLPYTMTPAMVADAARSFKPAVLYPYHYGETDPQRLVSLLQDTPEIEVRVRAMR
jgi:L-ascorbate metabolism protein UlaG (beta-lactamase superfamily)